MSNHLDLFEHGRIPRRSRIVLVFIFVGFISACDVYEDQINDDWSLCAVDDPNLMTLCRSQGDGDWQRVLDPVVVAWGYNGEYIAVKQCSEGREYFYSVDADPTATGNISPISGPLTRQEWQYASSEAPEVWPKIDVVWSALEKNHCPDRGERG